MKIAVAVGLAAAFLVVLILCLRRQPAPDAPMAKAPAPSGPADLPPKVAELDAAKSTPKSSAAPVDPGKLLAGLAKALRDSDEKAARAILKQLHGVLYPPLPDGENAILIYQKAFDIAREKLGGLIPKGL